MNTYLTATLHLIHAWLTDNVPVRDERGSVSTEQALWAGAVVILATLVIAAITSFVQSKLAILG